MWLYILLANALLGILGIEYSFSLLKKYRDGNEQRDSAYQLCRRNDAKNWSRFKFYPGSIFMPLRMCIFIGTFVWMVVSIMIICIGHDFKKGDKITGFRKHAVKFVTVTAC